MMKKNIGFTLGEILIALSVIGVVATLVLPSLVNGQKAATAQAQFNTAYSLLTKAVADMDADNISVKPESYGSQTLYRTMKPYLKVTVDCGDWNTQTKNTSVCISRRSADTTSNDDSYRIFNKRSNVKAYTARFDDGAFVLNNGMMFAFENPGGVGSFRWITIDINGKNKLPNRWGWDLFTFELIDGDVLPLGAPGTSRADTVEEYCNPNTTGIENGSTCGFYAATNQDYFLDLYNGH